MERICCSSPVLSAPYGTQTVPYVLRILEDSLNREMEMLHTYCSPWDSKSSEDFYRREHAIKSHYYSERGRLEYQINRSAQQYYYGYVNSSYRAMNDRFCGWDYGSSQPYTYQYTYLPPKETTPVPTETKSYIITDSTSDRGTYYADGEGYPDYKTLAEAEKEAQRLARENPTEEFTIYQTVKKYKVAGTPLDTTVFV